MTAANYEELVKKYLFDPTIGKIIAVILSIIVVFTLVRFSQNLVNKYVAETSLRHKAKKGVTFFGYFLIIIVLATIFSDRLNQLTVALGVAGAGIAFALQEVIASIAGWIAISFGGVYRTGDRVQVGGIKGDIIDISILRTTLMEIGQWINGDLYDGRIVRISNSFIFKEPVFNYSADFPFLWDEIVFPIRYGSDWEYAKKEFESLATKVVGGFTNHSKESWKSVVKKYSIENARIDPMVTMKADENWISFTIRYIVDYRQRRTTKDKIYQEILKSMEASNDRIQVASTSYEISTNSPLQVAIHKNEID